jgi:hypothetical protein
MTARKWPGAVCADGYRPSSRDTYVHVTAYFSDMSAGARTIVPNSVPGRWTLDDFASGPDADDNPMGLDYPYRIVTATAWLAPAELAEFRRDWDLTPNRAEPALGFLGDIGDGIPRL